jgi:hypothetical protein
MGLYWPDPSASISHILSSSLSPPLRVFVLVGDREGDGEVATEPAGPGHSSLVLSNIDSPLRFRCWGDTIENLVLFRCCVELFFAVSSGSCNLLLCLILTD